MTLKRIKLFCVQDPVAAAVFPNSKEEDQEQLQLNLPYTTSSLQPSSAQGLSHEQQERASDYDTLQKKESIIFAGFNTPPTATANDDAPLLLADETSSAEDNDNNNNNSGEEDALSYSRCRCRRRYNYYPPSPNARYHQGLEEEEKEDYYFYTPAPICRDDLYLQHHVTTTTMDNEFSYLDENKESKRKQSEEEKEDSMKIKRTKKWVGAVGCTSADSFREYYQWDSASATTCRSQQTIDSKSSEKVGQTTDSGVNCFHSLKRRFSNEDLVLNKGASSLPQVKQATMSCNIYDSSYCLESSPDDDEEQDENDDKKITKRYKPEGSGNDAMVITEPKELKKCTDTYEREHYPFDSQQEDSKNGGKQLFGRTQTTNNLGIFLGDTKTQTLMRKKLNALESIFKITGELGEQKDDIHFGSDGDEASDVIFKYEKLSVVLHQVSTAIDTDISLKSGSSSEEENQELLCLSGEIQSLKKEITKSMKKRYRSI